VYLASGIGTIILKTIMAVFINVISSLETPASINFKFAIVSVVENPIYIIRKEKYYCCIITFYLFIPYRGDQMILYIAHIFITH